MQSITLLLELIISNAHRSLFSILNMFYLTNLLILHYYYPSYRHYRQNNYYQYHY
jgi:hypothetical protein